MNNKVKLLVASVAVGMAAVMTGCGGCLGCNSCAGCNGAPTGANTLTRSNWFTGTSYNGIQPSFIEGHESFSAEEITYDVTYDNSDATNTRVSLDYKNGTFKTLFYATEYDWANENIPRGFAPENPEKEIVYVYKTVLNISVKYTMKIGDKAESEWFDDSVETVSYFRAAGRNLQPVYSAQKIKSTSPANLQPETLENAYNKINVNYENYYNYSCTRVLSLTTEDGETEEKEHKLGSTVFDNSSLYIVARSMKLSSSLSQSVNLFSAAAGGTDVYAIVGSDRGLTDDERAKFTTALTAKELYKSTAAEGEEDKGVDATAVTVSFAGGNLHGSSQTIWYASINDADNNIPRATMLKLSVPISFGLGTLNYSLKEVVSTLWNGK